MTDGDNEPEELRPAPATGGDEKTVANSDAKVATGAGRTRQGLGGRMTPAEILIEADRTGITLRRTADSDRVLYRPEDAIGPELLAAIREQEGELMPYLKPWVIAIAQVAVAACNPTTPTASRASPVDGPAQLRGRRNETGSTRTRLTRGWQLRRQWRKY